MSSLTRGWLWLVVFSAATSLAAALAGAGR